MSDEILGGFLKYCEHCAYGDKFDDDGLLLGKRVFFCPAHQAAMECCWKIFLSDYGDEDDGEQFVHWLKDWDR